MERGGHPEENISMASIVEQMDAAGGVYDDTGVRTFRRGEIVEGTVAAVDRDGILIDVGGKSEGTIPAHELPEVLNGPQPPRVGDQVLAYVLRPGDTEGRMLLSLRQGQIERSWRQLEQQFNAGAVVEAPVTEVNKGGAIVNVLGLRGFVPMSQLTGVRQEGAGEEETLARLQELVGRTLALKVVEINRRRNRLILSERLALQERRGQRKDQLLAELQEGEVRHGRVTSLTDFGAFVDVGGADGLVHLSELSWNRVNRPSDVVSVGDEVDVMVLGVDRERKKIALSLRRTQPEPWAVLASKYHPGDIVDGTITKLAAFGAFARIDEGVEGLIHISELSDSHVTNPRQVVQEGERRRMRILRVEPERRRLGLSLRGVPLLEEPEQYGHGGYSYSSGGHTTIGEAAFGQWQPDQGQWQPGADQGSWQPDQGNWQPDQGQWQPDQGQGEWQPDQGQGDWQPDQGQWQPGADQGSWQPDQGQWQPEAGQEQWQPEGGQEQWQPEGSHAGWQPEGGQEGWQPEADQGQAEPDQGQSEPAQPEPEQRRRGEDR